MIFSNSSIAAGVDNLMKRSQKSLLVAVGSMISALLIRLNQDIFFLIELSDGFCFVLIMTLSLLSVGSLSYFMIILRAERLDSIKRDKV